MILVIIMEQPKRKQMRLKDYDYSQSGAYFVTISVKERKKILCDIVGDGVYDIPKTILSPCGKIVEKYIQKMNSQYNNVCIDKFIIMPNHIHLIIKISNDNDVLCGMSQAPYPTANAIIPKFVSLFKRYCNREYGENIFQRSFHDHIIRNQKDYEEVWEYIENNPKSWLLKNPKT